VNLIQQIGDSCAVFIAIVSSIAVIWSGIEMCRNPAPKQKINLD
jgi:hypothetical protein